MSNARPKCWLNTACSISMLKVMYRPSTALPSQEKSYIMRKERHMGLINEVAHWLQGKTLMVSCPKTERNEVMLPSYESNKKELTCRHQPVLKHFRAAFSCHLYFYFQSKETASSTLPHAKTRKCWCKKCSRVLYLLLLKIAIYYIKYYTPSIELSND